MRNRFYARESNTSHVWPALVDVITATLMILMLFMIIQYISITLSDAVKRLELKDRQKELEEMVASMVQNNDDIDEGSIQIDVEGDQQRLRFSSELLFPSGSATIPPNNKKSFEFLNAVGELLKSAYYEKHLFDRIYIEGHTDDSAISTYQYPSNWELSTARAVYVTKYLINMGALEPAYSDHRFLGAAGFGEYSYVDSREDKDANRRIEILLIYSEKD